MIENYMFFYFLNKTVFVVRIALIFSFFILRSFAFIEHVI
jgi:hypothetical protein